MDSLFSETVSKRVRYTFEPKYGQPFIIVRIMEPFWFFAAIVVALPGLAEEETAPLATTPAARLAGRFA